MNLSPCSVICLLSAVPLSFGGFCDLEGDPLWRQVFSDEFDGSVLDTTKWGVVTGAAVGECRDALCTPDNVYIENGRLVLRSQRQNYSSQGRNFTTGAVNTRNLGSWQAGQGTFRVCISAQLPGTSDRQGGAQGIWPAHWLMPQDSSCDPDEGEMDIMEMINGEGTWYATYHWETTFPKKNCSYPEGHEQQSSSVKLPSTWNSSFHEFAVERGTDHVAYALDGVVKLNITANSQQKPLFWDVPWYLILNTAIGGGWPGPASSDTVFPAYHQIDYVRVAQQESHNSRVSIV